MVTMKKLKIIFVVFVSLLVGGLIVYITRKPTLHNSHPSLLSPDYFGMTIKKINITVPNGHCISIKELVFRNGDLSLSESKDNIWFSRDHIQNHSRDFLEIDPNRAMFVPRKSDMVTVRLPSRKILYVPECGARRIWFAFPHIKELGEGEIPLVAYVVLGDSQEHAEPFSPEGIRNSKFAILVYYKIYPPDPRDERYAEYYMNVKNIFGGSFAGPFPLKKEDVEKWKFYLKPSASGKGESGAQ